MSNTLNDLRYQLKQKTQQAARRMSTVWQAELRGSAPHDTYQLRSKTSVNYTQNRNGVIWTALVDVPYAEAQAYGARPHLIRARRASALRFYWPRVGRVVFFKQVNHPGNQPNPWWKTSLQKTPLRLQRIWDSL